MAQEEQDRKLKKSDIIQSLCDYIATFCSNLSVIGFGVCLFKTDKDIQTIVFASCALLFGLFITFIRRAKK